MGLLELHVSGGDEAGEYAVEVVRSDAGEASGVMHLSVDELAGQRDDVQRAILASTASTRRAVPETERLVRDMGEKMFDALFGSPSIAGRYRASLAIASGRGESLRLALRIASPDLASLPWEALFDPETGSYLSRREPLLRRIPVPSPPLPLAVSGALRILAIVSSPRGLPALDVEDERRNLETALKNQLATDRIKIHWLNEPTWERIQDTLLSESWHVVHFIGHSDFDETNDEGILALVDGNGRPSHVEASRFADLLSEATPMPRLVVLNSCTGGFSGTRDMFAGSAAALVRSGVMAVAAMQFEITDVGAIAFSRGFYAALVNGRGVDDAVRSGRVSILGASGRTLEWITPVLYLRGDDTHVFSVEHRALEGDDLSAERSVEGGVRPDERAGDANHREARSGDSARSQSASADLGGDHPDMGIAPPSEWNAQAITERLEPSLLDSKKTRSTIRLKLNTDHQIVMTSGLKDTFEVDGKRIFSRVTWAGTTKPIQFDIKDADVGRIGVIQYRYDSNSPAWRGHYRIKYISVDGHLVPFTETPPAEAE